MIRMTGGPAVSVHHGHATYRSDADGVLTVPPELEARFALMGFQREVVAPPDAPAPDAPAAEGSLGFPAANEGAKEETPPPAAIAPDPDAEAAAEAVRQAEYQWLVDNGEDPDEARKVTWPDAPAPDAPAAG